MPPTKVRERLALNLFDLDRLHPELRTLLLPVGTLATAKREVFTLDGGALDGDTGVPLICDLLRGATVIDLLRNEDRKLDRPLTRSYIFRERCWTKIPGTTVLTESVSGKSRLSSAMFNIPVVVKAEHITPLSHDKEAKGKRLI